MIRTIIALAALAALAACAGPAPTSPAADTGPPTVSVDDVAGTRVSWCTGATSCADGSPDDATAIIHDPSQLQLPPEATQPSVSVGCNLACVGDVAEASVPLTGDRIGALPSGNWEYLMVHVALPGEGTAAYAWLLR